MILGANSLRGNTWCCARLRAILAFLAVLAFSPSSLFAFAPPPPTQPVLVITDSASANVYENFVPEILTTEGFREFQSANLTDVTAAYLSNFSTVVLPAYSLTAAQAQLFSTYVSNGGFLIGLRPDPQLAGVFGVSSLGTTVSEAWLKFNTGSAIGQGLEATSLRFHGSADAYQLGSATVLATLYSGPATATPYPAVALNTSGSGTALLFAYDLAQSIVQMRQGNPAWAGYPNNHDGFTSMRASQMFFDKTSGVAWNSTGDGTNPVDRNDIPQADEQMKLLANALILESAAHIPLPRFWYLPNQNNAMFLMSGDNHADGDTANAGNEISTVESFGGFMDLYLWYPFGSIPSSTVTTWAQAGQGIGIHFDDTAETDSTNVAGAKVTFAGMSAVIANSTGAFPGANPGVSYSQTNRNHDLLWASTDESGNPDQTAQARIFQTYGIGLDDSFSSFPNTWGYMTGSGLPMKFLDPRTGAIIPVYEQATQYEDDIQLGSYAYSLSWTQATAQQHYQQSLSDSLTKYHNPVTMLFHPDQWTFYSTYAQTALQYAQVQGIPIWSPQKWLSFWSGRAATGISNLSFSGGSLSFNTSNVVSGLTMLIPNGSGGQAVSGIQVDGAAQSFRILSLEGIDYASFIFTAGNHSVVVSYSPVWSISGQVTPSEALPATTLTITGGPESIDLQVSPAPDGTYHFDRLLNGSYTITPSSDPYSYQPSSQTVTVAGGNIGSVNFAATVIPVTQTLFTTQTPTSGILNDGVNYELGTEFQSDVIGDVTAIRFWKASGDDGTHVGNLWSASGQLLASATFNNETASGWQQQSLSSPIRISANTPYIVSVNTANNLYMESDGALAQSVVNLRLSSTVGNNGLYGNPGQLPTSTYASANYFRDVVFTTNRTYVISGTMSPASDANGAAVTLSGFSSATTTVNSSGNYNFTGLANGTYTITPSEPGFTFTPASQNVTVSGGDLTTVNFTVSPVTYTLAGMISPVAAANGATIALDGPSQATTTADASGNFSFSGLVNGVYGIHVTNAGYVFSPNSVTATVAAGNVTGISFTGSQNAGPTYTLSGNVTGNVDVSGAKLLLSGSASGATVIDQSGNYSFTGLIAGNYVVTPQRQGVTFAPASQSVSVQGNTTAVNFSGAKAVQIESLFTSQTPVSVNLTDGSSVNYELGTKFTSAVAGQITAIRFWKGSSEAGTHTGKIWSAGGQLLASATFANETASGWQVQYLATPLQIAANTVYVVSVNTSNSFYVVTNAGLSQPVVNQDLSSVVGANGVYGTPGQFPTSSFDGSNYFRDVVFVNTTNPLPTSFSISGTVTPASLAAGATVSVSGASTGSATVDASGDYSVNGLSDGTYTVVATKGGFSFTPASQTASVQGADPAPVNFTASALTGANPVVLENSFTGTTDWELVNPAFAKEIQGYAGAFSVNKGQSIVFYVNSGGASYTLNVYRLGWYQGLGGRLMFSAGTLSGQAQAACTLDPATGMTSCGWSPSFTLNTGTNWTSGFYVAHITRTDTGKDNHIYFVVRDDSSTSDILFQSSFNTMEAYNNWGGYSLYYFQSPPNGPSPTESVNGAGVKVSFDRPFNTFNPANAADDSESPLRWDYMMVRFLESNGFNVSYFTDIDNSLNGATLLPQHRIFMTDGHSEYWTSQMRNNVEAARADGINLAFFSANTSYWQVRYEASPSGTANRVMVGYKENAVSFDPLLNDPNLSTTRFRDSFVNRPENQLLGVMYGDNTSDPNGFPFVVTNASHPFFRNTGMKNSDSVSGMVGNEWDNTSGAPNSNSPANIPGLTILSDSPTTPSSFSNAVTYQAPSGSIVFAAGSIQWAWGLDDFNTPIHAEDSRIRQMTANVLMDEGAIPQTPASDIVVSSSYSISGQISPALAGATLQLSGAAGTVATSDASGKYIFKVLGNGSYTITPSKPGYSFTPSSQTVTINGASLTGINFTQVKQTFSISGSISPVAGGSGATVTLGGSANATTQTDGSGDYSFTGLTNGSYTVTPSNNGYTFGPSTSQSVAVSDANVTGVNFTANKIGQGSFVISGAITPASTSSTSSVALTGTISASANVDSQGNYSFSNVPNGNYTVTPTKAGDTFTPANKPVTIAGANVGGVNFTVAVTQPPQSLFTSQTPAQTNLNDGVGYELGMRFTANTAGQITAVRFWKASSETGVHTGNIWDANGNLLATVTFTGETASGWQQQALSQPLAISANTEYMVSVNTGNGFYVDTTSGLASQVTHGNLFSIVGSNDRYGTPGQYPTNTYSNSNYFRDVVFVPQ